MAAPDATPYRATLHYDPTREGVWIGFSKDLDPVCHHRSDHFIAVTGTRSSVECKNCLAVIAKD